MRTLYLVCYDISETKQRNKIHRATKAYAIGGQKSFYECWLTPTEFLELKSFFESEIDLETDRVHFFQLDPRLEPQYFGKAKRQSIDPFFII